MISLAEMLMQRVTPLSQRGAPREDKESSAGKQFERNMQNLLSVMEKGKNYKRGELAKLAQCSEQAVYRYVVELLHRKLIQRSEVGREFIYYKEE